jgi:hypothetical protein
MSTPATTKKPRNKITKNKSIDTSTVEDRQSRIAADLAQGFGGIDEFQDIFTGKVKPVSTAWVSELGREMVSWAANDQRAYKIGQFLTLKGLDWTAADRWRSKFPDFDRSYRIALNIIGDRREVGAIENKYNTGMVMYKMPKYDPSWKKMVEWREKLKQTDEVKMGNQVIYVVDKPAEDCPEVKLLIKDEE